MKTKTRKKQQAKTNKVQEARDGLVQAGTSCLKPRRSIPLEEHSSVLEEAVKNTRTPWNKRLELIQEINHSKDAVVQLEHELLRMKKQLKEEEKQLAELTQTLQAELYLNA